MTGLHFHHHAGENSYFLTQFASIWQSFNHTIDFRMPLLMHLANSSADNLSSSRITSGRKYVSFRPTRGEGENTQAETCWDVMVSYRLS